MKKNALRTGHLVAIGKRNLWQASGWRNFMHPGATPVPPSVTKLLLMMKMLSFFLLAGLLTCHAGGKAQHVTLSGRGLTFREVFRAIEQQTGYVVFGKQDFLPKNKRVTLHVRNAPLSSLLEKVLDGQGVTFELDTGTGSIVLSRETISATSEKDSVQREAWYIQVRGQVLDTTGSPLVGASVQVKGRSKGVVTGADGWFTIEAKEGDVVVVSFIGHQRRELKVSGGEGNWVVVLPPLQNRMEEVEVVSTGYQQLPKERATGAFTFVSREMLNRSTGPDILTRLEGITNGLLFNRTGALGEDVGEFQLESRGRATIMSESSPLIILNNFPYDGDIRDINPNDVENVTILRDAAAASIWGARAGNGVIVITTRQGQYNRKTEITVSANTTISSRPNLFYDRNYMPSEMVMQIEKERFLRGDWTVNEMFMKAAFSQYAELLIKQRDHLISEEAFLAEEQRMKNTDLRNDALKYLYQNAIQQQYSIGINGGSDANRYFFSAGFDKSRSGMIGDDSRRLTLNMDNTFRPVKKLEITARMRYAKELGNNNAINITDLGNGSAGLRPYYNLADENGNPLSIEMYLRTASREDAESKGYLPWSYVPLEEVKLADNTSTRSNFELSGNVRYHIVEGLQLDATFQYAESAAKRRFYYSPETYFVRNLVNNFTQADGSKVIPYGGILRLGSPTQQTQYSGRVSLNGSKTLGDHSFMGLAGAEIRQFEDQNFPGTILYNYNDDLGTGTSAMNYNLSYPTFLGSATKVPGSNEMPYYLMDRYLSYFANASHTFRSKYILSGSTRWDGSNLFGVKTNQKGTLLWSAGMSWDISGEKFFKATWVDHFRLRTTYGSSGNVNKDVSVFPVIRYDTPLWADPNLAQYANIISPGNPSLKWERVTTFNIGFDWSLFNKRVSGTIDLFQKDANDLIGDAFIAPSTGINSANFALNAYRYNYASLRTRGIDLQFTTRNITGGAFKWQTTWWFNLAKDKVKEYYNGSTLTGLNYVGLAGFSRPLEPRRPVSGMYVFPWHGLDPTNGKVVVKKDGQVSTDYAAYLADLKKEDLVYAGVTAPPVFGSVLNNFEWKRLQLSVLLAWKAGYVYGRRSVFPGEEYNNNLSFHSDLLLKWKQPGDEQFTHVPAGGGLNGFNTNEAAVYNRSEVLMSRGDHIAIQDINLGYVLSSKRASPAFFKSARIFLYARNLGFLWKADKNNVDPNTPNARYPQPKMFSGGVQVAL